MSHRGTHVSSSDFPELPPLPFDGKPKRFRSAQSITACGTPTPQSYSPDCTSEIGSMPHFYVPKLVIPINANRPLPATESPRIQRMADSSIEAFPDFSWEAKNSSPVPTPACRRLYEFQYPPVPKSESIYKRAKKAEYDGDYESAMRLYIDAIDQKDRPESAIKDYAGLLHMRGQTKEAIEFLEERGESMMGTLGYTNLMAQLKSFLSASITEKKDLPKLIFMSIDAESGMEICFSSLPRLFPNHLKISRIVFVNPLLDDLGSARSQSAFLEFASHSAARKALMVTKHAAVKCHWVADNLLDDNQITQVIARDTSLVKLGPIVKVTFAIVPIQILKDDWPRMLAPKNTQPVSPPLSSTSTRDSQSPLQLPVLRRCLSPVKQPGIELDMDIVEANEAIHLDWCLNTPSPVRHIACLL